MKLIVHVDGGARGNPGPAAAACVISSPDGEVLDEHAQLLGTATNNVAEYRALLLGLARARELGASEVEVIGDSELIAKQVQGLYKVKHPAMRPLYLEAMQALAAASSAGRSAPCRARRTPAPTRSSTPHSITPPPRADARRGASRRACRARPHAAARREGCAERSRRGLAHSCPGTIRVERNSFRSNRPGVEPSRPAERCGAERTQRTLSAAAAPIWRSRASASSTVPRAACWSASTGRFPERQPMTWM